jgi:hypothetical protein
MVGLVSTRSQRQRESREATARRKTECGVEAALGELALERQAADAPRTTPVAPRQASRAD